MIEVPLPAEVPPQLLVYHFHAVASFNVPELILSVLLLPLQIVSAVVVRVGRVGALHTPNSLAMYFLVVPL